MDTMAASMSADMSTTTDPAAATAAPIASLETNPEHARATDTLSSPVERKPSPTQPLSLDPKLAPAAEKASQAGTHKRQSSLSLDPKLAPTSPTKPRASTDIPLSLGATTAVSSPPASIASPTNADAPTTPPFSPSSVTPVLEKPEPELDFQGNVEVNNDLPTEKDLKRVDDLLVLDSTGESRPFKALYKGEGGAPRQLVIFIRHFFCGLCQEYIRELSAAVSPEQLLALEQPTFITIVGCGRPELIDMYAKTTSCPFPIYADPTRKLYDLLGMTRTLEMGKKPEYIQSNMLFTSVQSIMQSLKTGSNALKGGDFKQVGGEFLFEEGKAVWAHRMRNTRDHAEVKELRKLLGLESTKIPLRKRWSHGIKMIKDGQDRKRTSSWGRSPAKAKPAKDAEDSKTQALVEQEKEKKKVSEDATAPVPATTPSAPAATAPTAAAA